MTESYPEQYPLSADQESDEEDPEKLAREAGVDPTAQEVDEYRERIGDLPAQARTPDGPVGSRRISPS